MDDVLELTNPSELRAAALGGLLERYQFLKRAGITFGGKRDMYDILGYLREIAPVDYRDRYARGGIAARIVEAMPRATWRGGWELVEDENPKVSTDFEKTWDDLEQRLHIGATLLKTDILAGQGRYAVLLIGTANDFNEELKKGKPDGLLYLTPFSEEDATIQTWVTDTSDPRFNLPLTYQLKRTGIASMNFIKTVHWSHVIHIAEGTLDNEVFGQPTLERVWNLLDDLDKITGGGAEAFWLRANQGLQVDVDKTMTLSAPAEAALKAEVDEYRHNISRVMKTKGVKVETLGSDVANFNSPADAVITQIAGSRAIPKRILTGSEMGELASSQDRDNWKDQVNGRQTSYASPFIVRPLVDRFIRYGYLPTPKQYEVRWAQIQVLTESEKADGAKTWADVNSAQGTPVFLEEEIRDKWYGMGPLTPEQLAKAGKAKEEAVAAATPAALVDTEADKKDDDKKDDKTKARAAEELRALDHKFSTTQINLPIQLADVKIPVDYLVEDGRETDPHVTVKYGVHAQNPNGVRSVVSGFGPITLTLGKTATFVNKEGYDVLYVSVESPDLVRLNKLITEGLDTTSTTPSYIPHATIAYLKAGKAKSFVGLDTFEGQKFTLDTLTFSNVDGERTAIDLIEPASVKAAEEAEDAELLQVLQAAVETGNTSVIDAIIGVRHLEVRHAPAGRPDGGQFISDDDKGGSDVVQNRFEKQTLPLRKKAKFGDQVVALVGDKVIAGHIARPGAKLGTFGIKQKDGSVVDVSKSALRMPKAGFKQRELAEALSPRWLVASVDAYEFTDRYDALGIKRPNTKTMCRGQCEGTGYIPIYMNNGDTRSDVHSESETDPTLIALWQDAEREAPEEDGWHFVKCPDCQGTGLRAAGGPGSGNHGHVGRPGMVGGSGDSKADAARAVRLSDVQTAGERADPVFQDMLAYAAKQAADPDADVYEKEHLVVMARAYREAHRPYEEINVVGSDAQYQGSDGNYTVERQAIHREIVDRYIAKFGDVQGSPRVIITGGLPGAGKSTGLKFTAGDTSSYTTVNSDDIKELLPEYNGGTGAAWLHTESDYVARDVLRHAVAARQNIVLDVTMKAYGVAHAPTLDNGTGSRIKALSEAGYRTSAVFTDIDVKNSVRNAMNRYVGAETGKPLARGEGRFVPPDYIRSARVVGPMRTRNRETFEQIKSVVSDWTHFKADVSGPRGAPPIFVAEGKN